MTRYCTYDVKPYVTCTQNGEAFGMGTSIAATIESVVPGDHMFTCLKSRGDVLDALKSCECDVGIGDFTEESVALTKGSNLSISYPYQPSAYVVLQRHTQSDRSIWGMFKPFTPGLWFLVATTPFCLALFMTFFAWAISKYKKTSFSLSVLPQYSFQNTLSFLNDYTNVEYLDWDGRMPYMICLKFFLQSMLVSFAFLCLIVTSVYTAQLTNIIISRDIFQEYLTFEEVVRANKRLVVPDELSSYFSYRFSERFDTWTPDSTDSFLDQVEKIRNGSLDAVVAMVGPSLWSLNTQNAECLLQINPGAYKMISGHAFMYSACTPGDFVSQRNDVIVDMVNRGVVEIQTQLLLGDYSVTNRPRNCIQRESAITIHDLAGGWVILAIGVSLPLLLSVSRYLYYLVIRCIRLYGSIFVLSSSSSSSHGKGSDSYTTTSICNQQNDYDMASVEHTYSKFNNKFYETGVVVDENSRHTRSPSCPGELEMPSHRNVREQKITTQNMSLHESPFYNTINTFPEQHDMISDDGDDDVYRTDTSSPDLTFRDRSQ
jgi:hypothetical protein